MALTISIGRGLFRSAYEPAPPTLAEILANLKSDFVTQFGDIDLSSGSLSDFATFEADAAEKGSQGDFETYAPYKGSMVRVYVNQNSSNVITWCYGGELYGLTENGLIHFGLEALKEYDAATIATM